MLGVVGAVAVAAPVVPLGGGAGAARAQAAASTLPSTATPAAEGEDPGGSVYVAVAPCRLLDTRGGSQPAAGAVVEVQVEDRCGVPDGAVAIVATVTVTGAAAPGYVTAWSGAGDRPEVSSLNHGSGDERANSAIVSVADGRIALFTQASAHLLVDVAGAFVPSGAARSGRYEALAPTRLVDTRTAGALEPGAVVRVPLPDGVPADAVALAVTVTTASAPAAGYLTAYPAGSARPEASVLNVSAAGQTRATGAIVPVSADGFDVYTSSGAPVIVDATGWFTGPSASAGTSGRYVAASPERLLDTRAGAPVYAGGAVATAPPTAAAAVVNVTMLANRFPGFQTLAPAGVVAAGEPTSSVNADRRMGTSAGLAVVPLSTEGMALQSSVTSHALIDLSGWFTGDPLPADPEAPAVANLPVTDPPLRALLVGDSTMAGIEWYSASEGELGGNVTYTLETESCRRLAVVSCRGRFGYVPTNAVTVLDRQTVAPDVVVVQAGYDDAPATFAASFVKVVDAARRAGATQIIWLTYRTDVSYVFAGFAQPLGNGYAEMNATLRQLVAGGGYDDVLIADFDGYSAGRSSWFASDGIHFTPEGAAGVAEYIARWVAFAAAQPCPAEWAATHTVASWCPSPDAAPPTA